MAAPWPRSSYVLKGDQQPKMIAGQHRMRASALIVGDSWDGLHAHHVDVMKTPVHQLYKYTIQAPPYLIPRTKHGVCLSRQSMCRF